MVHLHFARSTKGSPIASVSMYNAEAVIGLGSGLYSVAVKVLASHWDSMVDDTRQFRDVEGAEPSQPIHIAGIEPLQEVGNQLTQDDSTKVSGISLGRKKGKKSPKVTSITRSSQPALSNQVSR